LPRMSGGGKGEKKKKWRVLKVKERRPRHRRGWDGVKKIGGSKRIYRETSLKTTKKGGGRKILTF